MEVFLSSYSEVPHKIRPLFNPVTPEGPKITKDVPGVQAMISSSAKKNWIVHEQNTKFVFAFTINMKGNNVFFRFAFVIFIIEI